MPFTFAHPLYALPARLVVRRLSLSGLVLGSMAPDFEYFLALEPYATIGHTWRGFWLQALPLGVVLALTFHYLVKRQLARHLPSLGALDRRAAALAAASTNYNRLRDRILAGLNFLLALLIGFISHIVVDGFTHRGGYAVVRAAWLQRELGGYPVYKLLQHGLSLLGLAVLTVLILRALAAVRLTTSSPSLPVSRKLVYWAILGVVALATLSLKLLLTDSDNLLGITVVSTLSGGMLGIVTASVWSAWFVRRHT
ncbi:hypothetical protein PA598K_02835 [Paenibacillus sp. 598K]|uniref:DUF4184 family protein n=1 Tax=Paenibacillus sp. 598K TaxID=1117987 RepID=UPI000FFA4F0D|nr:DUF4184 family protein [Paenibacillus sp. 598K]GBF74487.1 hypothetical protein PA598K_02835 [Paenibacillus sp. 598K]